MSIPNHPNSKKKEDMIVLKCQSPVNRSFEEHQELYLTLFDLQFSFLYLIANKHCRHARRGSRIRKISSEADSGTPLLNLSEKCLFDFQSEMDLNF